MPSMPGSGHPVGGGIQTAYDGHGIILLGETASESTVFGVQGVDGIGFTDIPPTDAVREGNRRETALRDHAP